MDGKSGINSRAKLGSATWTRELFNRGVQKIFSVTPYALDV